MHPEQRPPKIVKELPLPEKEILTKEKIKSLAKGFSKNEEEVEGFSDFILNKFKKMNRRDFLKIATGGIGLAFGYKYLLKENIDNLWTEYQKSKIGETKKKHEDYEDKDLQSSIEWLEKLAEYPERIKKSEKQELNKFAKDLSKKNFDNLILGEWIMPGPISEKAANLLEELIKNKRKISAICFGGLSYTDSESIEATRKFNSGDLSPEEMSEYIPRSPKKPLLELARKHSIEIVGLEDTSKETEIEKITSWADSLKQTSKRVGDIAKEKTKDGIVATYVGQDLVTVDSWENSELLFGIFGMKIDPFLKEEALKNNYYTIKEYLEKINLRPVAVQIEDWARIADSVDMALTEKMKSLKLKGLPPKYTEIFYEEAQKTWQNYILEEKGDFVVSYPKGKDDTFAMVIPNKILKYPPGLTMEGKGKGRPAL